MIAKDFSQAEIIPNLPDYFHPECGDPVPQDLIGATINGVGTLAMPRSVEGGGLVVDYTPAGTSETKRLVFAFNELGMWVQFSQNGKMAARVE